MEVKCINYVFIFFFIFMLKTFISLCTQQSSFTFKTKQHLVHCKINIFMFHCIHTLFLLESIGYPFYHDRVLCLINNITIIIKILSKENYCFRLTSLPIKLYFTTILNVSSFTINAISSIKQIK